jgi:hypothetical protein
MGLTLGILANYLTTSPAAVPHLSTYFLNPPFFILTRLSKELARSVKLRWENLSLWCLERRKDGFDARHLGQFTIMLSERVLSTDA